MDASPYPEHQKLLTVKDRSQACYDFLDWLDDTLGVVLAKYDEVTEACFGCEHTEAHPLGGGPFPTRQCEHPRCDCDTPEHGNPDRLYPYLNRRDDILASHFDIDLIALEEEKRAMIVAMREVNRRE